MKPPAVIELRQYLKGLNTYERNQKMWRDSAHEANRIAREKRLWRLGIDPRKIGRLGT